MKVKNTDTGDTAVNALILTMSGLLIEWLIDSNCIVIFKNKLMHNLKEITSSIIIQQTQYLQKKSDVSSYFDKLPVQ